MIPRLWALLVGMETTISGPTIVGVRSAGKGSKLQSLGARPLLEPFSGIYWHLSLKYKYGSTHDSSPRPI